MWKILNLRTNVDEVLSKLSITKLCFYHCIASRNFVCAFITFIVSIKKTMPKNKIDSKMSLNENERNNSTNSASEKVVAAKQKLQPSKSSSKRKYSSNESNASSGSSSTSSTSTDSESDSSADSVRNRRSFQKEIVKKPKTSDENVKVRKESTNNCSKWDSPKQGKRSNRNSNSPRERVRIAERARSSSLGKDIERECPQNPKENKKRDDPKENEKLNYKPKVVEQEARRRDNRDLRENDRRGNRHGGEVDNRQRFDDRDHRQRREERPRERSRDRWNSRHNRAMDDRDRSRERGNVNRNKNREERNQSNDRWDHSKHNRGREGKDSTQFRRSRSRSAKRNAFRSKRSGSQDRNDESHSWGKKSGGEKRQEKQQEDKEKPNFGLSGALTEDTNKVNGVVVKYAEPQEARRPKRRWRLYPFKGETALPVLHIHRRSCFLVGRERKVVDLAVDHPSCSKQHAALQYRLVSFDRDDGSQGKRVRLYLIDLDSANGTFVNNKKIEPRKYYELLEKDVIKFGFSTREYVLLHENSKEDQEDDDVTIKEEPED